MNKDLQSILNIIQQSVHLSDEEKDALTKAANNADKELEIESSLERVRTVAMSMRKPDDLLNVCETLYGELYTLGFSELRNTMINIHDDDKGSFLNYDYSNDVGQTVTTILYNGHPATENLVKQIRTANDAFAEFAISGAELNEWRKYRKGMGEKDDPRLDNTGTLSYYFYSIGTGAIGISTYNSISEEKRNVLKRFRNVFDLAYRRFLDIKQAEAQARESQVQLALERVRARTMAMQKSDELSETAVLLFHQLMSLGLDLRGCGFNIWEKDEKTCTAWMSGPKGTLSPPFNIPLTTVPFFMRYYESRQKGEDFWVYETSKEELASRYEYLHTLPVIGERLAQEEKENTAIELPPFVVDHVVNFSNGNLIFITNQHHPEAHDVFKRFGKVFEQTYTRFLDLQKAEAQARESQIQLALERVRARTMAMQKSDELPEAANLLFHQVQSLGMPAWSAGYCTVDDDKQAITFWMSSAGIIQKPFLAPVTEDPSFMRFYNAWEKGEKFYVEEIGGDAIVSHYQYMLQLPVVSEMLKQFIADGGSLPTFQIFHLAFFSKGFLLFITYEPVPEAHDIFKRFAKVFGQTYTRFLDLQRAEAQTRQVQIEMAMEKVRARALAMQKPGELVEVAQLLRKEMGLLGVEELETSSIYIHDDVSGKTECWYAIKDNQHAEKKLVSDHMNMQLQETWVGRQMLAFYHSDEKQISIPMRGDNRKEWIVYCAKQSKVLNGFYGKNIPERTYHLNKFNNGYMGAASPGNISAESWELLRRAASVFSLAYTRFSDLQQAEAQAREATIEAALEKVRGKAMAMRTSGDVSATASMVFTELRKLGINPIRCGVGLLSKETVKAQLYSATSSENGDSLSLIGWVILSGHSVLENIYRSWVEQVDYFPELSGEQLKLYYEHLLAGLSVKTPDWQSGQTQYGHFFSFTIGCLYAWSDRAYDEAEIKILKRFGTIIDLTFRRYLELQTSEANARDAVKQSALDRVRADIASMRTVADLDRITPLIWNELTILGVSFIRCGVFIMDESQQLIHTFLSTPDGKAVAAFHLPYDTPGNFAEIVSRWRNKKVYIDHWGEDEFTSMADILVKQGAIATKQQYLDTLPPGGFYLHFLPFLQGMLYVGNLIQLSEDEINLIQSVADAFSTAYARYEDFNKLEAANIKIEKTLVDLKQTQTQLVQSEKMASLGELTAGIAHEIQNPLNFVNNFSDVNTELIEELKGELAIGNQQLAIEIANDIKANEEKINHHGKRADSIVKGMLQHSRTSTNQKEPTDINELADEYLRLSYHGLRAKDKPFNATMKTNFDESIGKINIIPQDIGRVLLNLYNNAFYAVNDKKMLIPDNYEPTITVATRSISSPLGGRSVEIKVSDNGGGIPQKIIDKIFQPFFTTKPTGQGTGLGLSLAYDIVKAHGGEIKVETKEARADDPVARGEGSEFTIQLPN